MQKIFLLLGACTIITAAQAQHTFSTIIKEAGSNAPVTSATILLKSKQVATVSDSNGYAVLKNIPGGKQTIVISRVGYETKQVHFNFPLSDTSPIVILLKVLEDDLEEVVIQSTRTSRTIKNTPTRVETIDGEELDEKNNMRPANVSMLLHESTGMQVQQTSATSGNASIRVQGLDGRYTQLLKDGYPNFGNFASGLSVLEIPPLDLKQVEVIKGPASTLYGGGAIAGVVNFISKLPQEKFEGDMIFNQSHIGQTNLGAYFSQKKNKLGYTILGSLNFQKAYDVDKDEFSEIPKSNNFTIAPVLFYYPNASTSIKLGNSFTRGTNTGGDMVVIKSGANANHVYFEENKTTRNTSTLELDKKWGTAMSLKLKQSLAIFDRHITIPNYNFSGTSTNSFTDLSLSANRQKHFIIGGINIVFDKFKQENSSSLNAQSFTAGVYLQDTWDVTDAIKIESGVRIDNVQYKNINYNKNQTFVLPRASVLFRDQQQNKFEGRCRIRL
ncbi:TonB-dependent receptor [Ferruginibacter sp.]